MAILPPFTNILMMPTYDIDSTPKLVFGSQYTCKLDSIWICNTGDTELFTDFNLLTERIVNNQPISKNGPFIPNQVLKPKGYIELLLGSVAHIVAGDLLYANSDNSSNLFNCFISYREFTELTT